MNLLLLAVSCFGPLPDPLMSQRAALAELRPPSGDDWAPQASLVLHNSGPEAAIQVALNGVLAGGLAPVTTSMFGVTATVRPELKVDRVRIAGSAACASCVELRVELSGRALGRLETLMGAKDASLGFTGALAGVLAVRFDGEQLVAEPAATDRWQTSWTWTDLPAAFNQTFSGVLTQLLQDQVSRVRLPPVPLVQLQGATPIPVAAARLRPGADTLALELAFLIPQAGAVTMAPVITEGWALVVPRETALGLLMAVSLAEPYDPEARATPEIFGLRLNDDRFELDLRAWPTRGRGRPREVTVFGRFGLDAEGDVLVVSEDARWLRAEGAPPDLTTLLFGGRLLDGLAAALSGAVPGELEQSLVGVGLVASTRSIGAQGDNLVVKGDLAIQLPPKEAP